MTDKYVRVPSDGVKQIAEMRDKAMRNFESSPMKYSADWAEVAQLLDWMCGEIEVAQDHVAGMRVPVEVSCNTNDHTITSNVTMCCAETGRVMAVFYNDYDAEMVMSKIKTNAEECAEPASVDLEEYDPGLLNDYGGNVSWWHDYLRAELGRAFDFYQSQLSGADNERNMVEPASVEPVTFTCHGNSAPAYSCNKPGDMSGTYYAHPPKQKWISASAPPAVKKISNLVTASDWVFIDYEFNGTQYTGEGRYVAAINPFWESVHGEIVKARNWMPMPLPPGEE